VLWDCKYHLVFTTKYRQRAIYGELRQKKGGGEKALIDTKDNIDKVFFQVIHDHIAGDPMDGAIKWTNLSYKQISEKMTEKGVEVGAKVAKKL
jgi:hypothetical protein